MTDSPLEIRCAVEIRADDTRASPGRIVGNLVTYGQRAATRAEIFAPGSLTWPADGVTLGLSHVGYDAKTQTRRMAPLPIGRFVPVERGNEIVVDYQLPDTERGRIAAALVTDGTLRDLSAEFHAIEEAPTVAGVREIRKAMLVGAGLVRTGDYGGRVEVRASAPVADDLWRLLIL